MQATSSTRRDMYKCGLNEEVAFNNRKRQSNEIRKQARVQGIARRRGRGCTSMPMPVAEENSVVTIPEYLHVGAETSPHAGSSFLDQVSKWKHSIWTGSDIEIQRTRFEVQEALAAVCEKRFVLEDALSSLNFIQIVYHVFRTSQDGTLILPALTFFAEALCSPHAEIVRFSCLTIINALDMDNIAYTVHEAIWASAPSSIIDIILALLPRQRDDVQRIMMLCLKTALQASETPEAGGRAVEKTAKLLPFLIAALGMPDLMLSALDCVSEMAVTASFEELDHIRRCGVLDMCISVIGHGSDDQADCVICAIETVDSFASCYEDAPSAWLIAAGVLEALTVVANADWITPEIIACICRITSNLAQSATEAVLSATSLCDAIVTFLDDDDLDDAVREEAFTVIECLTMTNGKPVYCADLPLPYVLDATQADALYNLGALTVLVDVVRTFASSNLEIKQRVLMCLSAMLDTMPQHAEDFAASGGIRMLQGVLKDICVTDGKYTLTGKMAARILHQHFPYVFSEEPDTTPEDLDTEM